MIIHYLQHVPFEDLGSMAPLLTSLGHQITATHLYRGDPLPDPSAFDALIIMGGPMAVFDDDRFPWLQEEKAFIRRSLHVQSKPILGVCLGAQLLADALGARVYANGQREIGWFPLRLNPEFIHSPWANCLNEETPVFHWHGDTFSLPNGSLAIGRSEATEHQGFIVENRIIGLQFHLETTEQSAAALIRECRDELDGSPYVQTAAEMLQLPGRFEAIRQCTERLLNQWLQPQ